MDLLGYAALGGLERLTIVAGAVIIGYWGYRLYTAEKSAGLIFMGLAVLVLVGALATGGSYLKSVGEGYQLASLPAESAADDSPFVAPAEPEDAELPAADTPPEPGAAETPAAAPVAAQPPPAPEAATELPTPEDTAIAEAADADAIAAEVAARSSDEPRVRRLATGAELGGRIVSVKSENVSLEWSADAEEPESGSE